jgi:hypothetical protein
MFYVNEQHTLVKSYIWVLLFVTIFADLTILDENNILNTFIAKDKLPHLTDSTIFSECLTIM